MSVFGLREAEVAPLVRSVAGEDADRARIEEAFARGAWTGIAEPGDRVAGALVRVLGASGALAAVVARTAPARLSESTAERGERIPAEELEPALARWEPRLVSAGSLLALRQAVRFGVRLLLPGDAAWPAGLDDLGDHAPLGLWLRGRPDALGALEASLALVGARAATAYGEHVTMEAASGLVARGYAIVSGAAYGIDGMAHRAALASGGTTIAVLAGGLDRFYPSGHESLLDRIVATGAVVAEVPCGVPPTKWRFLQRNRLIAAATRATIVLEAGHRSGSLNTAGHAASLGRPLGAVPGPVTSAASSGCHRLIREYGAECVTSVEEMAALAPLPGMEPAVSAGSGRPGGLDRQAQRVLDALSTRSPRDTAEVAARAGLAIATAGGMLAALELEGVVASRPAGWVALAHVRDRDARAR